MTNQEAIRILYNLKPGDYSNPYEKGEAIVMAINALQAQEWVPCKERLPEEDGLYLVTTSKGQVQVHIFNHNGNSEEYWTRCNKAWKPMQEPYQEDER